MSRTVRAHLTLAPANSSRQSASRRPPGVVLCESPRARRHRLSVGRRSGRARAIRRKIGFTPNRRSRAPIPAPFRFAERKLSRADRRRPTAGRDRSIGAEAGPADAHHACFRQLSPARGRGARSANDRKPVRRVRGLNGSCVAAKTISIPPTSKSRRAQPRSPVHSAGSGMTAVASSSIFAGVSRRSATKIMLIAG